MGNRGSTHQQQVEMAKALDDAECSDDVVSRLTEVCAHLTWPHASAAKHSHMVPREPQAQLDEFREAFAAYDKDGGGSIDAAELKMLMASVGQVPSDAELTEMIRIADADGSGSVDFYEFVTLMAHKMADVRAALHQSKPSRPPFLTPALT